MKFVLSDTAKGIERIYALSLLEDPPRRLPLGLDGVQWAREHIMAFQEDVDKYASWSEGLLPDA